VAELARSGLLRTGLAMAVLLMAVALAAPWLAPLDPNEQIDAAAGRFLPPGSVRVVVELADGRRLLAERVERTAAGVAVTRLGATEIYAAAAVARPDPAGQAERRRFLLGTDRFGRDLLSRLLSGARVSLAVGLAALGLALTLGVLVGAAAASGGPLLEAVLMRLTDALLAFPRLFLVLAAAALFRPGLGVAVAILGGTGWMGVARLVRAELASQQQRDYATAARALGASRLRVLVRHLLPNSLTPVFVDAALRLGDTILLEASLSFLGLGIQPPTPSWGSMIADGRDALTTAWWVAAFPGAAIAFAVVAFNLIGEGLRDRLDPHLARAGGAPVAG
jgi:peptide/nickel transport system permease protein